MDLAVIVDGWRLMGPGLAMTLLVSVAVMALGLIVGLLGGLAVADRTRRCGRCDAGQQHPRNGESG